MKVGIVGGGITGLSLLHYLNDADVEPILFEAADEVGGVIKSGLIDGRVVEFGPQRSRLTDGIEAMINELGLQDELVFADDDLPIFVYFDGALREVPMSLGAFVRTDLLSWPGKLRLLAEPFTDPATPDESPAEVFTRKFGPQAYRNMIGPLFGGIYGSDPAHMSTKHSLNGLMNLERREGSLLKPALKRVRSHDGAPAFSFDEGMGTLPNALYQENRDAVQLETPVESITETDDGFVLETAAKDEVVDRVVVTTPADIAADLLEPIAPSTAGLRDLTYNPLAMVYVDAEHDQQGLGYQIRWDEDFSTLGVSWNAAAFDRDGVHTVFLGGMKNPDLLEESDEKLAQIACEEFEAIMDVPAELISINRLDRGFPAYDESWSVLDDLVVPDGIYLATNYAGRMGVTSRIRQAEQLASQFADAANGDESRPSEEAAKAA